MNETTPQQRADWRKDAERHNPGSDPKGDRILALLEDLEAAEREHSSTLESARRLFVETRDLRIRAAQAERERDEWIDRNEQAEDNWARWQNRAEQAEAERDRLRALLAEGGSDA